MGKKLNTVGCYLYKHPIIGFSYYYLYILMYCIAQSVREEAPNSVTNQTEEM